MAEPGNRDELRAFATAELARVTPAGWAQRMVKPPWAFTGGKCRYCGGGKKWQVVMLTRQRPEERLLLFSFATVCTECVQDADRTRELADRVFTLQ